MADKPDDAPDDKPDDKPDPALQDWKAEADKWKAMARKHEAEAKRALDAAKARDDADKTEAQKLADRAADAEKRAIEAEAKALRLEVAAEKGVKARWLSGSTREELEAAADEYLADHPPANGGTATPTKPVEDLRGGGEPAEGPDPDLRKIVDAIPRGV